MQRNAPARRSHVIWLLFAIAVAACDTARAPAGADAAGTDTAAAGTASDTSIRAGTSGGAQGAVTAGADTAGGQDTAAITLFFSRDETAAAVQRPAPPGVPRLEAALRALVRGPTGAERESGLHSWFSDSTAHVVRSVRLDDVTGHAVIDFEDLRPLIPNASTSAGSAMLLRELSGTIFAVPGVQSVEYRLEGSCETFWEWLQYGGCQVQERSDVAVSARGAIFDGIPATRLDGTDQNKG